MAGERMTPERYAKRRTNILVLAGLFGVIAQSAATAAPGAWQVKLDRSPLTGKWTFAANLQSENDLLNQIGLPQKAALVVRCQEGVMASYVSWPQVVTPDFPSTMFRNAQTMAYMRVDDGKIFESDLDVSDDGTGVGKYTTVNTRKWLDHFSKATKVIVRIKGTFGGAQDAVFDTTGIDDVQTGALVTCGLAPGPMPTFASTPTPATPASPKPSAPGPAGIMGVLTTPTTPQILVGLGLPPTRGVMVIVVVPRSPGERAGLAVMDVNRPVRRRADYSAVTTHRRG